MKEEIGIDINPNQLTVVHIMHRKAQNDERIDFFMTASTYSDEVTNCEPEKCDDLRWFPLNELPENIVDYVKLAIEHYKMGIHYSEFGWDK